MPPELAMAEILTTIAEHVRGVVERRRREMPLSALRERPLYRAPTRGFANAVSGATRRIIAEVKKASPSKGLIRADFDAVAIARDYAAHGASAISVLTEDRFFHGDIMYLEQIRAAVSVPLLRKDFMLDGYQIDEAKSYGADAVLFIAAMLEREFDAGVAPAGDGIAIGFAGRSAYGKRTRSGHRCRRGDDRHQQSRFENICGEFGDHRALGAADSGRQAGGV